MRRRSYEAVGVRDKIRMPWFKWGLFYRLLHSISLSRKSCCQIPDQEQSLSVDTRMSQNNRQRFSRGLKAGQLFRFLFFWLSFDHKFLLLSLFNELWTLDFSDQFFFFSSGRTNQQTKKLVVCSSLEREGTEFIVPSYSGRFPAFRSRCRSFRVLSGLLENIAYSLI